MASLFAICNIRFGKKKSQFYYKLHSMEIKAKVESTFLNYQHGMLTAYLTISGNDLPSQKFGGTFCSDSLDIICDMLDIGGAKSWEDMLGKEILACVEDGKIAFINDLGHNVRIGPFEHVTISDVVKLKSRG